MTMLEWFREVKARPEIKRIIPLGLVFLSGLGFSIQSLTIKKLEEDTNYSASFQLIFVRGISQLVVSSYFIYTNASQPEALANPFGSTPYVKKIMAIRSVVGYGGICFAFLAIEALPLGDATVLVMLSPLFGMCFLCWL
jgi:drug/metabolite transporter (DMT)-like permease